MSLIQRTKARTKGRRTTAGSQPCRLIAAINRRYAMVPAHKYFLNAPMREQSLRARAVYTVKTQDGRVHVSDERFTTTLCVVAGRTAQDFHLLDGAEKQSDFIGTEVTCRVCVHLVAEREGVR